MHVIEAHIREHQARFSGHRFFSHLKGKTSVQQAMGFAPDLSFWVLTFQNVLRLNETRVESDELRRLARAHRIEDAGHDRWFLEDLAALRSPRGCNAAFLFSRKHVTTRDAAYDILGEVLQP